MEQAEKCCSGFNLKRRGLPNCNEEQYGLSHGRARQCRKIVGSSLSDGRTIVSAWLPEPQILDTSSEAFSDALRPVVRVVKEVVQRRSG